MFTNKSHCNKKKLIALTLILCVILCSLSGPDVFAKTDENNIIDAYAVPIDEYIIVTMVHEYSFPKKDYEPSYFGEEYVKSVEAIFTYQDGDLVDPDTFLRIEKLYLTEYGKKNIDTFIDLLSKREDIVVAEKDYLCSNVCASLTPNDPYLSNQYAVENMMLKRAWAIATGSETRRVGIIDTGINSNHEDLTVNTSLSQNYVTTDTEGLNDGYGHGTGVAGVATATGYNNLGICGVAWRSNLINLRVVDSTGHANNADIVSAVNYAKSNNISIINMSLHNLTYSADLQNALNTYLGTCVVSAGNNHGSSLTYPANYNLPCMIVVAATNYNDVLLSNSDYHPSRVHLAAPGGNIYTTDEDLTYGYKSGTSFAAPQVTGTIVLMRQANATLTAAQIKSILLEAVDAVSGLSGMVSSGGRLNTFRAVRLAKGYLMGDSNLDGVIDASDSRQVLRWAVDLDNYSNLNEALCDVDYDNDITAADAQLVLQMAVGLIDPIQ